MRKRPSCLIWMSAVAGREPARKKMTHSGVLSFNFSNFLNVFFEFEAELGCGRLGCGWLITTKYEGWTSSASIHNESVVVQSWKKKVSENAQNAH